MNKSNTLTGQKTINIRGSIMDLSLPRIMGIINITPDSFFGTSRKQSLGTILDTAERMLMDGATFLDIGGYSSRPDAADVSEEEEVERIAQPIYEIVKRFPQAFISIDTFRARVAYEAVQNGAHIVNDIAAGSLDPGMIQTVADMGVPYIGMHMRGTPQTMQQFTQYEDILKQVMSYFAEKIAEAHALGINDYIVDPGLGFAKTTDQNYYLLNNVEYFKHLYKPLLVGVSRKSMIYKLLNITADEALNGTTVLNTVALLKGASILRVHDVKEAVQVVKLVNQLMN